MRHHTKTTTEGLIQLDIRYIARKGSIQVGNSGTITWSKGISQIAKIQFNILARGRIALTYQTTMKGQSESVTQSLQLESTPCHLGGSRQWCLCPDCGNRVAILYFPRTRFSCRHCHNLSYQSQRTPRMISNENKQRRLSVIRSCKSF